MVWRNTPEPVALLRSGFNRALEPGRARILRTQESNLSVLACFVVRVYENAKPGTSFWESLNSHRSVNQAKNTVQMVPLLKVGADLTRWAERCPTRPHATAGPRLPRDCARRRKQAGEGTPLRNVSPESHPTCLLPSGQSQGSCGRSA